MNAYTTVTAPTTIKFELAGKISVTNLSRRLRRSVGDLVFPLCQREQGVNLHRLVRACMNICKGSGAGGGVVAAKIQIEMVDDDVIGKGRCVSLNFDSICDNSLHQ